MKPELFDGFVECCAMLYGCAGSRVQFSGLAVHSRLGEVEVSRRIQLRRLTRTQPRLRVGQEHSRHGHD